MTDQESLNRFLHILKDFLVGLDLVGIQDVEIKTNNEAVDLKINSQTEDAITLSSENCELTVEFGQSHWHISSYSDPLDLDSMKLTCIRDISRILNCEISTYSAWHDDTVLGGGSCTDSKDPITVCKDAFPNANRIIIKSFGYDQIIEPL
jgi:hypothetical protein